MNEREEKRRELEQRIGYAFQDRTLLDLALTHPSARYEKQLADDNQRLEYLGDAVLGLVAAEHGYRNFTGLNEGKLTWMRSQITRTEALAGIASDLGLGHYLEMGRGEAADRGAEKPSNLANALESLAGALYLDGGLTAARVFFEQFFAGKMQHAPATLSENPKGLLQEFAQKHGLPLPEYLQLSAEGPSHQPWFSVKVSVGTEYEAMGSGASKRTAEADAAAKLLEKIR